jgi:hypothetical protein
MVLGKSDGRRVVGVIKTGVELDVLISDEYLIPRIVN